MIVKEHQLEKIVKDTEKFLNILIYGPNEGLVREQIEKLTKDYFVDMWAYIKAKAASIKEIIKK